MNTNKDIILTVLKSHHNENGNLVAIDHQTDLKNIIKRTFIVTSSEKTIRGRHAHKELTQYLICVNGICEVICDDGNSKKSFTLDSPNKILKIPKQIWAEQHYLVKNTSLVVMCDDIFSEEDYIRDYEKFKDFRKNF